MSVGYVDGIPHTLRWAGGTDWNNITQGVIANGHVYHLSAATSIDITDHTLDGIGGAVLSYKGVGITGPWNHRVVSPTAYMSNGSLLHGDCWYGEISVSRANSDRMVAVFIDRAIGNRVTGTGSYDGGDTWITDSAHTIKLDGVVDLGLIGGGRVFIHTSSFFEADLVDVILVEDIAGAVTNGSLYHTRVDVSPIVTIDDRERTPRKIFLHQNYPNPFNASTTIEYSLPSVMEVSLEVYNILGQKVRTLKRGHAPEGEHQVVWDGRNDTGHAVGSGVYLVRLHTPSGTRFRKVMMLK